VRAATALVALLVAAVPAAQAEIYRWVDGKGVVNYGSKPPEGARNVRQLDENAVTVSTIPAPPRAARERQRELALEARVERLERELQELERARAAAPTVVVVPAAPAYAPAFFAGPAFGHPFATRAVFPRRAHFAVRHGAVRVGIRR
jgi:hypothetical protein